MAFCRLCGQRDVLPLFDFGRQPIAHRFLTDPDQAEYTHSLTVEFCEGCGLTQLGHPIPPALLYTEYNWLSSWKWQPHVRRLGDLIEQLPELKKTDRIVEIGSNDGSFLEMLRQRGYRNLLGIEPAQDAVQAARQKGVETLGDYFTKSTAEDIVTGSGRCDLVIMRQVLEHITDLASFREAMCTLLSPAGYVLVEVPNFDFSLDTADYSGVWEEHVNYFTPGSLERYLADADIRIRHSETVTFSGEALVVLGQVESAPYSRQRRTNLDDVRKKTLAYRDHWPRFREAFVRYLQTHREAGGKTSVYGAGCRACSLINFTGVGPYLENFFDDQPEKQGKYMPGSHLPVLPGSALEDSPVDLCLLAVNAENDEKVIANHRTYQGNGGSFVPILPPSDHLLPFWEYT